jgi:hypothetical protein
VPAGCRPFELALTRIVPAAWESGSNAALSQRHEAAVKSFPTTSYLWSVSWRDFLIGAYVADVELRRAGWGFAGLQLSS